MQTGDRKIQVLELSKQASQSQVFDFRARLCHRSAVPHQAVWLFRRCIPVIFGWARRKNGTDIIQLDIQKRKSRNFRFGFFIKDLAVTYSRGSYTTTTIGKTAFDGRVRDGNGSDHSFITTKSLNRRAHANLPQCQQCFCTATFWT